MKERSYNRQEVTYDGQTYPSLKAAAEALGVTTHKMRMLIRQAFLAKNGAPQSATNVDAGLACPSCGSLSLAAVDSRPRTVAGYGTVMRRRQCNACGFRFRSYELNADHFDAITNASKATAIAKMKWIISEMERDQ